MIIFSDLELAIIDISLKGMSCRSGQGRFDDSPVDRVTIAHELTLIKLVDENVKTVGIFSYDDDSKRASGLIFS